jgi:hypothetical protein
VTGRRRGVRKAGRSPGRRRCGGVAVGREERSPRVRGARAGVLRGGRAAGPVGAGVAGVGAALADRTSRRRTGPGEGTGHRTETGSGTGHGTGCGTGTASRTGNGTAPTDRPRAEPGRRIPRHPRPAVRRRRRPGRPSARRRRTAFRGASVRRHRPSPGVVRTRRRGTAGTASRGVPAGPGGAARPVARRRRSGWARGNGGAPRFRAHAPPVSSCPGRLLAHGPLSPPAGPGVELEPSGHACPRGRTGVPARRAAGAARSSVRARHSTGCRRVNGNQSAPPGHLPGTSPYPAVILSGTLRS